jgi:type II secretory pathway component GspD/PulD (secretin)
MYRIEKLDSPSRYVVTFPGAIVAPACVRAVALHPAREGAVSVQESDQGATVVIPADDGELCSARPGAFPQTVLCGLARGGLPTRVADRPEPGTESAEPSPAQERPAEALINVDFQDAPVVEILTALARYAEKNIITTPAVTGNMSVSLSQVTLTEALDLIVALNNFEYVLVGDRNYVVGTPEEIARLKKAPGAAGAPLPLELVYQPQNTTPQRIAQELAEVVKERGVTIRIVEDAKSMVFMNVPDEATLEWLREHAVQVDVPPQDTTRWVQLEHLTPAQAEAALKGLTPKVQLRLPGPEAGQVAVIALSGKSVDVDEAETILKTIDVAPPVGVEPTAKEEAVARTLRVSYIDPEAIVTLITSMFGEQVQAFLASSTRDIAEAQGTQEAGGVRPAGTIVVRGPEAVVAAVEQLVAQVDVPPPQVQITATITDITGQREGDVGATWTLPGLIVSEENTAKGGFNFGKIVRGAWNTGGAGSFQATLDALLKNTSSTILSRTKLVAVNGKSADFLVGDIIPYEVAVAGDGTVTRSVEFENVGLGLKFSPTVDTKDQITIFIAPQVRSFSGFTPQGYPIVSTREAQTIARVSDGDIIVIGGLLRDEELKTLSGVPFMRDIPLFGELFKKRQTTRKKSEIVVFAEVKLLRPGEAPASGRPAEGEG